MSFDIWLLDMKVSLLFQVRRASAKCIEAIVSTRHDFLVDLYKNVSTGLIARFKVLYLLLKIIVSFHHKM